jgi:membrane protease YdiL (CAAX protease family)
MNRLRIGIGAGLAAGAAGGTVLAHGNPVASIVFGAGLSYAAPGIAFGILAQLGRKALWARIATGLLAVVVVGIIVLVTGVFTFLAGNPNLIGPSGQLNVPRDPDDVRKLGPPLLHALGAVALCSLPGLAAAVPAFRRFVARVTPLDAESFPDAVALYLVVTVAAAFFSSLLVAHEPIFGAFMRTSFSVPSGAQLANSVSSMGWAAAGALYAVGYGTRRNAREAFARLGLMKPSARDALVAAAGLAAVFAAGFALDHAVQPVWRHFGWPQTHDEDLLKALSINSVPAAFAASASAGFTEELLTRGVLQPRLGVFLTALFFTSLHAWQYQWDGLLSVFVTGLLLGEIRRRSSTTTSAIVHGSFDFIQMVAQLAR